MLVEAGGKTQSAEQEGATSSRERNGKVADLILERNVARSLRDRVSESRVPKLIQEEVKAVTEARRRAKIDLIPGQFRELKELRRTGSDPTLAAVSAPKACCRPTDRA